MSNETDSAQEQDFPILRMEDVANEFERGPDGFVPTMIGVSLNDREVFNAFKAMARGLNESEDLRSALREEAEKHVPYAVHDDDVYRLLGVLNVMVHICEKTQEAADEAGI